MESPITAMGVHPKGLDKQYLDLMWRDGFRSLMITPESVSDTMLANYYLSEDLDLDEAVSQMFHAAAICPEIYLGFDEKLMSFSRTIAGVCRLLRLKGPYWKYMRFGNVVRNKDRDQVYI